MRRNATLWSLPVGAMTLAGCGSVQEVIVEAARSSAKESIEQAVDEALDDVINELLDFGDTHEQGDVIGGGNG